jgi:hypothetical protein
LPPSCASPVLDLSRESHGACVFHAASTQTNRQSNRKGNTMNIRYLLILIVLSVITSSPAIPAPAVGSSQPETLAQVLGQTDRSATQRDPLLMGFTLAQAKQQDPYPNDTVHSEMNKDDKEKWHRDCSAACAGASGTAVTSQCNKNCDLGVPPFSGMR